MYFRFSILGLYDIVVIHFTYMHKHANFINLIPDCYTFCLKNFLLKEI